jgi:hypothetical protein
MSTITPPVVWTEEAENDYHRAAFMNQRLTDADFCGACLRLHAYCTCGDLRNEEAYCYECHNVADACECPQAHGPWLWELMYIPTYAADVSHEECPF